MSTQPTTKDAPTLLRVRHADGHARVSFVELFFDLVFVFAVTQVAHHLLHHLSPAGAAQSLLLMIAVWWVWVYTAWVTNWLDPDTTAVRVMLFVLMLLGLVMAASIPKAFDERALWFAGTYVAMQLGRSVWTMVALRQSPTNYRNFQRISAWFAASAVLWLAGALAGGATQVAMWTAAIALELAGPSAGFWTPSLGRSASTDWHIAGGHMAERCGLFVIIALGESVLVTGATFSGLAWSADNAAAFAICVIGSIAMWWIYFDGGAARASELIAASADPGAIGRFAYTYIHVVIVAGIIASAAADTIILKQAAPLTGAEGLTLTAGPALFILGCLLFKWATAGRARPSHFAGFALLGAIAMAGRGIPALVLGGLAAAVLVSIAAWDTSARPSARDDGRPDTARQAEPGDGA